MMLPTIHLNGTSPEALFEGICEAAGAIRRALDALAKAAPNARDYYPQGQAAFGKADAEHEARAEHLRAVLRELEEIAEYLADERDRRAP